MNIDTNRDLELYVRDVVQDKSGTIIIVGIPNNGKTIKVGDLFSVRYELSQEDILNNAPNPARLNTAAVSLSVSKIDVMRQQVSEVHHGVTCGFYFEGTGLEHVMPKCFLRT